MKKLLLSDVFLFSALLMNAQTLATGGQFIDLLLPMEGSIAATASDWGTTAGENTEPKYAGTWAGTLGRWKNNGIEDTDRSYWGGNIIKGSDDKYHIYVSGWPESTAKGHMAWSSASRVYHVKSDNVWGPYEYVSDIGAGHNSEIYKTGDTYVIYHIEPLGIYTSTTLGDSWTSGEFRYDKRERILIAGENTETSLSNCSFAKREDGSFVMIDRGGGIWVSRDGLTDPWHQLTDKSVYLNSEVKNRGYLEDPVIWRDHLQYHMIVNDWNARYAYYYRSLDGLHWVKEAGKAYCAEDNFAKHSNGDVEQWHKYERPRVYQDEMGRAIRMNFAVIDCVKQSDLGGDNHSSKNINMPLTKQLLLEVQTISSTSATVLVKAEDGFNPRTDLNLSSLKFGSHSNVNYGNGFSYSASENSGTSDLIITFSGSEGSSGITADEWAPKMLGETTDGSIAFGYAKMPGIDYKPAMLSALTPTIAANGTVQHISVTNYGQSASVATTVRVYDEEGSIQLAHGTTSALAAYDDETIDLEFDATATAGYKNIQIRFYNGETLLNTENIPLTAINAKQSALQTVIDEANALYDDETLTEGKDDLKDAIDAAEAVVTCYNIAALEEQSAALNTAINTFKYANASLTNGMSITISNGTCDDLSEWTMTRLDADNAPGWKLNTTNRYGFDGNFIETYKAGGLSVNNKAYQTLTDMPAGRYRLRVKVIATNNGSAVSDVKVYASGSTLTGSPLNQAVSTGKEACTEYMLELTLSEAGDIEFGIDIASTSTANWVCFDTWTLKYFGTAEGSISEEETATFDANKTYYIKNAINALSYVYLQSPKYNAENDNNLYRTNDQAKAAQFKIVNDPASEWLFYLYDVVSHQFVVPSANNTNGTAWTVSATKPGKVRIADNSSNRQDDWKVFSTDQFYTLGNNSAGFANAYSNDNSPYAVKNYGNTFSDGNQWAIVETGNSTNATLGINPQAVYRLKHYNTARNRYFKAPEAEGNILATSTDSERGQFSLLPVSGSAGYFYIYSTNGYFVTPAAGNWTYSKSTPAAVKVEANLAYMEAKSDGNNVTYLLGENNQHANVQTVSSEQVVKNYANQPADNGNNWMLEPVSGATASLSLNDVTSNIESLVTSIAAENTELTYTATVGTAGFGTLVVPFEADVTGDVEAWQLTSISGSDRIQGTKVTTIEANKPVLLKNTGTLSLTAKEGTASYEASPANGLLQGTYTQETVSAGNYVLQKQADEVAFFKVEAGSEPAIKPFRAYLSNPSGARMLSLSFGESTGINSLQVMTNETDGTYYNLQGMQIAQPQKGIYIKNGKKMIIK